MEAKDTVLNIQSSSEERVKMESFDDKHSITTVTSNGCSDQPEAGAIAPAESSESQPLSKKALKRLAKKGEWDRKKKEKRKLQKLRRKEAGIPGRNKGGGKRRRRFKKMVDSDCKIHIVVDLSFDNLMVEKDIMRCANQINRSYSVNRALTNPTQFHVTSFNGASKEAMGKIIGFENWDVAFHEDPYDAVFEKEKLVYLTSDSKNVISELDENKVYVIGGIVDHNSKKGLCHLLAEGKGIQHARLPLQEYVDMKTRNVLTINQVFSILGNVAQGKSWQDAILLSIPPRKNARAKNASASDDDNDGSSNEDDNEDEEEEKFNETELRETKMGKTET